MIYNYLKNNEKIMINDNSFNEVKLQNFNDIILLIKEYITESRGRDRCVFIKIPVLYTPHDYKKQLSSNFKNCKIFDANDMIALSKNLPSLLDKFKPTLPERASYNLDNIKRIKTLPAQIVILNNIPCDFTIVTSYDIKDDCFLFRATKLPDADYL